MWLLIAFIAIPLIEIALFIQIGGWLTLWPTLLIVVLTAIAGTILVRSQGARTMLAVRSSLSNLTDPTEPLAHGAMILFSGALLLTPGFLTDAFGFSLLIPAVRGAVFRYVKSKVKIQTFDMGGMQEPTRNPHGDRVIDGEFEDISEQPRGDQGPSGWTRH